MHSSISATGSILHSHIITIDSATGPNLIDIELLKPEWRSDIQPCQYARYIGATGHSIRFHVVIHFYAELADMQTRIWFGVVRDLQPKVLLGNPFNSRQVKAIHPKAVLVRLLNSLPALILANRIKSIAPISIPKPLESTRRLDSNLNQNNHYIRVA